MLTICVQHPFVDHDEFENQDILRNNIVRGSTPYQPLQPIGTVARDLIAKVAMFVLLFGLLTTQFAVPGA
jgi:hypothetical protein